MLGLEPLAGLRVVGDPAAIDRTNWSGGGPITVVRIAPDEAFAVGADTVDIEDPHAIAEPERGFSCAHLDEAGLERLLGHLEFSLPPEQPALVQGKIAGVPAKLLLRDDGSLLLVQTAYADELVGRLR